ncbi:hypothetical protein B0H17DRAFT_1150386, partial [Mycena rosella]
MTLPLTICQAPAAASHAVAQDRYTRIWGQGHKSPSPDTLSPSPPVLAAVPAASQSSGRNGFSLGGMACRVGMDMQVRTPGRTSLPANACRPLSHRRRSVHCSAKEDVETGTQRHAGWMGREGMEKCGSAPDTSLPWLPRLVLTLPAGDADNDNNVRHCHHHHHHRLHSRGDHGAKTTMCGQRGCTPRYVVDPTQLRVDALRWPSAFGLESVWVSWVIVAASLFSARFVVFSS